jgi:pimeloyl-ACP methyl ester carboxylesterase
MVRLNMAAHKTIAAPETPKAGLGSTRRGFILSAAAAASYGNLVCQGPARAAIVRTDTASLSPLPLPSGIRPRYVKDVNGLTFHVLEAGFETKGRPCLLLLHGYPELAYGWRKVMLPLASAGFHVIAPDMRGYGRTTGWDDSYDGDVFAFRLTNLVRDALGLVSAFGYSTAAVVGRDAGSPVAAYCALMPTAAEIAACKWLPEDELAVYSAEYARTGFQGGLQGYRRIGPRFLSDLQTYSGRTIDVPSLFIGGKSDWGVFQQPGAFERMQTTACTQMRGVHLIDGAGHWLEQEQPEQVTKLLIQFFQG